MGATDNQKADDMQGEEKAVEKNGIEEFVRECEGLKMHEIFEKAGFKRLDLDKNASMRQIVDFHRRDHFELGEDFWKRPGEEVYGNAEGEKYFVFQTKEEGKKVNWFYMHFVNADHHYNPDNIDHFESKKLDPNPSLKEIAKEVASHRENGVSKQKEVKEVVAEETREKTKENLHPSEEKIGE